MRINNLFAYFVLAASNASFWRSNAFQIPKGTSSRIAINTKSQLYSSTASLLPLERSAVREIGQFESWAVGCGVQPENGFCLGGEMVDGNEDYYAGTSSGGSAGSRVLFVPGEMILSSAVIAQEFGGYVEQPLQDLEMKGQGHLIPQFLLFLKILLEYEKGTNAPYYTWMAALPRKWNTAVSMDSFCLDCLPPFIKSLCLAERIQLRVFREALQSFEYLTPESKKDDELMRFAYNVVFTRSFPSPSGDGDFKIVPMADMLNHGFPGNVELYYDENGSCEVILKEDVAPGTVLNFSYGEPTNPSRFLATYGFLNEASCCFCKIYFRKPSEQLIKVGYDPENMLFSVGGDISQGVWDVLLYSRLERKPALAATKIAFYQAIMTGDYETKEAIHNQYRQETRKALLRHVDFILVEVNDLLIKMNAFDSSKHPRLPLLRMHHEMVTTTFGNVKQNLLQMDSTANSSY